MASGKWERQDRYGWGWSVYGPDGMPGVITPVSTAAGADAYAAARNAGKDHAEAWAACKATGAKTRDEYDGE